MKKSSASPKKELRDILEKRRKLLERFSGSEPLVAGYVYDVMRKCGNPYCHCAVKPGHRQTLLIHTEKGHRHCRLVRRKDEKRIKQAWKNSSDLKNALREIRALNQRELAILRAKIAKRRFCYE